MRGLVILLGWSTLALFGELSAGQAQQPGTQSLESFAQTPFYKQLVVRAVDALPKEVFQRCPELQSKSSQITVTKPVTFAADGYPSSGAWRQVIPVSGCGNDTTLNLFVSATSDEKVNIVIGLPGSTHADLRLQTDALLQAETGVLRSGARCDKLMVKDTRFEGYGLKQPPTTDPGRGLRPWWETWMLVGCDKAFEVPMDFVPDANGTQIIQPAGIVSR